MIGRNKKYFTLFGMLAASVDMKINKFYAQLQRLLELDVPRIINILISTQLKPVKQDLTNKIYK